MPKLLPFAGQPTRWDRPLPEEPSRAYQAAMAYFQMGPDRSHEKVAEMFRKSVGLIGRWSRRWHWVSRAREYDTYRATEEIKARSEAVKAATRRWSDQNVKRVDDALDLAEKIKAKVKEIVGKQLNELEYTLKDAGTLVKAIIELERFALDLTEGVRADPGVRTDLTPAEQSAALEAMTTARLAEEARQASGG